MRTPTLLSVLALASATALAGPIDPPAGPVGPTMKTLDEVEARIAINTDNTPGDSDALFVITQPGSYYLTQNWTINGTFDFPTGTTTPRDGIRIEASNVTVDLNGFTLEGGLFEPRHGIVVDQIGVWTNILIQNGSISGFTNNGIDSASAERRGLRIRHIRANSNLRTGIAAESATVEHCESSNNDIGINADSVLSCVANLNRLGIQANTVLDSQANDNTASGLTIGRLGSRCTAIGNGTSGILVLRTATVEFSNASENGSTGIFSFGNVRDCVARENVTGIFFDEPFISPTAKRIERNIAESNETGFRSNRGEPIFIGNIASGNDLNWDIAAGAACYVVNLGGNAGGISGDSGGTPLDPNPWANFTR